MANEEIVTQIIAERAQETIRERWEQPIVIETTMAHVQSLIGICQLALRHPYCAISPSARVVEKFLAELIEKIDPEHGDVWRYLNAGFNPAHDVIAGENEIDV